MKKRYLLFMIAFLICICGIKYFDVVVRYDIDIISFFKYSRTLTETEKKFMETEEIHYGIDVNDEPFAFVSYDTNQNMGILVDYFNQRRKNYKSS